MTTSIDANVISALWRQDHVSNSAAMAMLIKARLQGQMVISAPVYAELIADPKRTEAEVNEFLLDTGIQIDWNMNQHTWREAGVAYRGYAKRRKKNGGDTPRRILADFMIGAHAYVGGHTLLTLDGSHYAAAFPTLHIVSD